MNYTNRANCASGHPFNFVSLRTSVISVMSAVINIGVINNRGIADIGVILIPWFIIVVNCGARDVSFSYKYVSFRGAIIVIVSAFHIVWT